MNAPAGYQLIGRWCITQVDLWDSDHLDLFGPAMIVIADKDHGEVTFGALQAGFDLEYSHSIVFFTWQGHEEIDKANGSGAVELLNDGSIESEFNYHLCHEAVLKAKRDTSSTAC